MKRSTLKDPATKQDIATVKENISAVKENIRELKNELEEKIETSGAKFRDDILTRLDDVMGQLESLREDRELGIHQTSELREDVDDHEKRIKKIEKAINLA